MQDGTPERTNRDETTRLRRALLVETAITCFVKQGIARTGMRDIASKAGVSVGNLYNHVPGRDAYEGNALETVTDWIYSVSQITP